MNEAADSYPFETVGARVLEKFNSDTDLRLLVLPSCPRADGLYYSEFDSTVLEAARAAGISEAAYLDDYADRRHIHEYGAHWLLDVALAIPANLAADLALLLVRYVWSQVRNARGRGLIDTNQNPEMRLSVGSFERGAKGELEIKDLAMSGDAESVVLSAVALFAPQHLESARQELEMLKSADEESGK